MLAIQHPPKSAPVACIVNLLPCNIRHTGPANASTKHWTPTTSTVSGVNDVPTTYFRGRKLLGNDLILPEGYTGAVLELTDNVIMPDEEDEDEEDEQPEKKQFVQHAEFGKVTVWAHEELPNEAGNNVMRGLAEWGEWSKRIHSWEDDDGDDEEVLVEEEEAKKMMEVREGK
ncbi:ribonuclease H2 non-catalytic subunit-domain-containing protein [Geopyxis carbonaria]|nr:ribonuclease H2 non-catalytic subunit-domain-containing protein [Geopyxis carbonaria]